MKIKFQNQKKLKEANRKIIYLHYWKEEALILKNI